MALNVVINDTTVTGSGTAPNAPTNLTIEPEWDSIRLHWDNPSNRDLDYIQIWRSTTNNINTATMVAQVKANDYNDHSLETGIRYYWIRAINTVGQVSNYLPNTTTTTISGTPEQVAVTSPQDKQLLQYDSAANTWVNTHLRDDTYVLGNLRSTTNTNYTFPAQTLNTVSGGSGIAAASSMAGTSGYSASTTFTHYYGDTRAGPNTAASFNFQAANGVSDTSVIRPWEGTVGAAASAITTNGILGSMSFTGYATTDWASYISAQNQGGGLNVTHPIQYQCYATETFANGTLTITPTAATGTNVAVNNVQVTGTRGQISFNATTPSVGNAIVVTGTNTGTSTGITAGTYYIIATASTTTAQLSATPGGDPITTTAGTTTGLTFSRQFLTITYATQANIPFGLNAKITIAGIGGVTAGTYMAMGTSTTTQVLIGAPTPTGARTLTSATISCPTVTNAGCSFRVRGVPVATPLNSGNRFNFIDHSAASATYRADTFTIAGGAYGGTGATRLTMTASEATLTPELTIANANTTRGGAGYASMMVMTNQTAGATNINKYIRLNSTGGLEVVNSAYSAVIATIADNGDFTAGGSVTAATGFFKYPVYTRAALTAITGQVGWTAAVSDSSGSGAGARDGQIAYWDLTNARWSYIHDNSAV